jgi:hypothetical protein
MSRVWRLASEFALVWLSFHPGAASAQESAALQRRVTRLDALRHEAAAALARADSARWEALDTVRAGSLVIVTRPSDAALVRRAAELAWGSLDSLYGDAARRLETQPMLLSIMTRPFRYVAPGLEHHQRVMAPETATPEDVARQLTLGAAAATRTWTDSAVANWLGPILLPAIHRGAEHARVYVELVTAPSAAVRLCYNGNTAGCRAALGLLDGGDAAALWYDAAERRDVVRRTLEARHLSRRPETEACVERRSDSSCLAVLHAMQWFDAPLSAEARHSLARLVLDVGGRAAYTRLLRYRGRPLSERLAFAAGVPRDSLMARWRSSILAARPKPVTITAPGAWTALGWAVVFALLALRSSRWR